MLEMQVFEQPRKMWFFQEDSNLYTFLNLHLNQYLIGHTTDLHSKYYTCLCIRQLSCQENVLLSFLLLALFLFLQIALIQSQWPWLIWGGQLTLKQECFKIQLLITCQKKGQSHKMHIMVEKGKEKKRKKENRAVGGKSWLQTCERRKDQDKQKQVPNTLNA